MARKKTVKTIISCTLTIAGIALAVIGALRVINLDANHANELRDCELKDYSSYIKYDEVTTPGNKEINEQVEVIKKAMESASVNNDVEAFGQLYEKYTYYLQLQSQTNTVTKVPNYDGAEKAKNRCYASVEDSKESDKKISIGVIVAGVIFTIIAIIVLFIK